MNNVNTEYKEEIAFPVIDENGREDFDNNLDGDDSSYGEDHSDGVFHAEDDGCETAIAGINMLIDWIDNVVVDPDGENYSLKSFKGGVIRNLLYNTHKTLHGNNEQWLVRDPNNWEIDPDSGRQQWGVYKFGRFSQLGYAKDAEIKRVTAERAYLAGEIDSLAYQQAGLNEEVQNSIVLGLQYQLEHLKDRYAAHFDKAWDEPGVKIGNVDDRKVKLQNLNEMRERRGEPPLTELPS